MRSRGEKIGRKQFWAYDDDDLPNRYSRPSSLCKYKGGFFNKNCARSPKRSCLIFGGKESGTKYKIDAAIIIAQRKKGDDLFHFTRWQTHVSVPRTLWVRPAMLLVRNGISVGDRTSHSRVARALLERTRIERPRSPSPLSPHKKQMILKGL